MRRRRFRRCCHSHKRKDGFDPSGRQTYECARCGKKFTDASTSAFSGMRFPIDVIVLAVKYYLRYPLSGEAVAQILGDRGVTVTGNTILEWANRYGPLYAEAAGEFKRKPVGKWHVDETYVKVNGKSKYLYRAIDAKGVIIDVMLSARRDKKSASRFFRKAIMSSGRKPKKVITDKYRSYPKAIKEVVPDAKHTATGFYNRKENNNQLERNHGYEKQRIGVMRGFKSFHRGQRFFKSHSFSIDFWKGRYRIPNSVSHLNDNFERERALNTAWNMLAKFI